jgi:hypothetical protein
MIKTEKLAIKRLVTFQRKRVGSGYSRDYSILSLAKKWITVASKMMVVGSRQ